MTDFGASLWGAVWTVKRVIWPLLSLSFFSNCRRSFNGCEAAETNLLSIILITTTSSRAHESFLHNHMSLLSILGSLSLFFASDSSFSILLQFRKKRSLLTLSISLLPIVSPPFTSIFCSTMPVGWWEPLDWAEGDPAGQPSNNQSDDDSDRSTPPPPIAPPAKETTPQPKEMINE